MCVYQGSDRVCGARCACVCVGGVAASEGSDLPGAPSDSHRHWEREGLGNRSPHFLKVQALGHLVLRLPPPPQHSANRRLWRPESSLCLLLRTCGFVSAVIGLAHSLPYLHF